MKFVFYISGVLFICAEPFSYGSKVWYGIAMLALGAAISIAQMVNASIIDYALLKYHRQMTDKRSDMSGDFVFSSSKGRGK